MTRNQMIKEMVAFGCEFRKVRNMTNDQLITAINSVYVQIGTPIISFIGE